MLFIDYGNTQSVNIQDLKCLPEPVKVKQPQAMECVLAKIQPSIMQNSKGLWSECAIKIFKEEIDGLMLYAKIYSVVASVVYVELYKTKQMQTATLNQWLIDQGYAQPAEESYLSKENHEKRELCATSDNLNKILDGGDVEESIYDIESPDVSECNDKIHLKGPFSPLEMRVYGITNSSMGKSVKIETTSVNTVLLDAEPQDPHARCVI